MRVAENPCTRYNVNMTESTQPLKIIDYEKKGNLVRFYLGDADCEDYYGDDWDDTPYEHNAGTVYSEYIKGHRDVCFPFDFTVMEVCDGVINSNYCKNDFKEQKVPCIVLVQGELVHPRALDNTLFATFYFGDPMQPSDRIETFQIPDVEELKKMAPAFLPQGTKRPVMDLVRFVQEQKDVADRE